MEIFKKILPLLSDKRFIFLALLLAVLIPYSNIYSNDFAYDDPDFFLNWEGIKHVDLVSFFSGSVPLGHHHVYRPIRHSIQSIVYQFTAIDPIGYHIFAILVHLANVYLIYFIVKKITHQYAAFASALIFAVLPVHVESITFIIASFNSIGITFLLSSLFFYIHFQENKKIKYYWYSVVLAFMAYFTYELTIILPLLMILYDVCIRNYSLKKIIASFKIYLLYIAGSLGLLFVKFILIGKIYKGEYLQEINIWYRMLTMTKAFVQYIYLVIVNYPLSVYYDIAISRGFDEKVALSLIFLATALYTGIYFYKKEKKIYTFIIFWFFISLIPVSNIIQLASFANDNYLYLASAGWSILVGITFYTFFEKLKKEKEGLEIYAILGLSALIIIYGYITWERNFVWKNDETLWAKTLEQYPEYTKPYNNLSLHYIRIKNYDLAEQYAKKAIDINPQYSLAYGNLGNIRMEQKRYAEAIEYFVKANGLKADYASWYHNIGYCYQELGKLKEAEENYKKAIELLPSYHQSHKNFAVLLLGQKRTDEALEEFKKAISLEKDDFESFFGVGMIYVERGDTMNAREYFKKALEINPNFAPAREKLNGLR